MITAVCKSTFVLLLLSAVAANAGPIPDANGYVAQHECRAGNPNCDVDVVALANQACEQTIHADTAPSNSWSAIDWSRNVICIAAGNHFNRGTLTLASSGSPSRYKVLRYFRDQDNGDEPWNQDIDTKATIAAIDTNGAGHWAVHRFSFTQSQCAPHVTIPASSSHIILSRILTEGIGGDGDTSSVLIDGSDIWLQNSVIRKCQIQVGRSYKGVNLNGARLRVINSEIYDCAKGVANSFFGINEDHVIENNDVYNTVFTDCNGNFTPNGDCAITKGLIAISSGSQSRALPLIYIHNRIWGEKWCDTNVSCSGSGSSGMAVGGGANGSVGFVLRRNNIITDSGGGFENTSLSSADSSTNGSTVGNILYRLLNFNTASNAGVSFCCSTATKDAHEIYLNTFIDVHGAGWIQGGGITNSDVRCNAIISSQPATGLNGSGTQIDHNVYYDSGAGSGESNRIVNAVSTRQSSHLYNVGEIVRTAVAASCVTGAETACYLYKVTRTGTSSSTNQSYCASLGCTQTDGSVQLQAIRGPLVFKRKLRTTLGGEPYAIPFARAHQSAPEAGSCPASTGARQGIGVSDEPIFR